MKDRTEQQLRKLPTYQLTCEEFAWLYPDKVTTEHFKEVKNALKAGLETYEEVYKEYPILQKKSKK